MSETARIDTRLTRHTPVPGAETVLLLHSVGTTGALWTAVVRALDGCCSTIAPDLLAHGSSPHEGPFDLRLAADDMEHLCTALVGDEPVHVVGVALGSPVAMLLAAHYPKRVRTLTVAASFARFADKGLSRCRATQVALAQTTMDKFATTYAKATLATLDSEAHRIVAAGLVETGADRFLSALKATLAFDISRVVGRIEAPLRIVVGDLDERTPLSMARDVHQTLGGELHVMPGAGHLSPVDRPNDFAQLIHQRLHLAFSFPPSPMAAKSRSKEQGR